MKRSLASTVLALTLVGCPGSLKARAYHGPDLARDQSAVLYVPGGGGPLSVSPVCIAEVNGYKVKGLVGNLACPGEVALKPGPQAVRIQWFESNTEVVGKDPVVNFEAKAGKSYKVFYQQEAYSVRFHITEVPNPDM